MINFLKYVNLCYDCKSEEILFLEKALDLFKIFSHKIFSNNTSFTGISDALLILQKFLNFEEEEL